MSQLGPLLLFSLSKGSRRRSNFFSSNSSLALTKPLPEAEMSCHSPLRRDPGDVLPLSEAEMSCHSPKRRCNSDSNTMAIVTASATATTTATHHGVSDSNSLSNNSISSAAPTTTATTCCALPPATETSSKCHHPELAPSRALGSGLVVAKEGLVVAW